MKKRRKQRLPIPPSLSRSKLAVELLGSVAMPTSDGKVALAKSSFEAGLETQRRTSPRSKRITSLWSPAATAFPPPADPEDAVSQQMLTPLTAPRHAGKSEQHKFASWGIKI